MTPCDWQDVHHHYHHYHYYHLSLNREGRWGTTDDFATSFQQLTLANSAIILLTSYYVTQTRESILAISTQRPQGTAVAGRCRSCFDQKQPNA